MQFYFNTLSGAGNMTGTTPFNCVTFALFKRVSSHLIIFSFVSHPQILGAIISSTGGGMRPI
jgi:hypothetical protein